MDSRGEARDQLESQQDYYFQCNEEFMNQLATVKEIKSANILDVSPTGAASYSQFYQYS